MSRLVVALMVTLALAGSASAEQVTISLSTQEIRVDSTFDGETVTLFGVIERDAATISRGSSYEVAVLLRGPTQTVVERRKDRIAFVWVNSTSEILTAPSFYALNTTSALSELSVEPVLERYQIGFNNIAFEQVSDSPESEFREFRQALIRLKQDAGLYVEQPAGVSFIGGSENVFQSALWVPANAEDGRYVVQVFLFSGDALLAHEELPLHIVKVGIEQFLYNAAMNRSLIYGLTCVVLALFVGWLGGLVFRRD